ncbi:FAD-dependent oxidoreductase [Candidatus Saccharibacteria bacterium]|nr:FAD-dependent oxidoreductase [Candidatus Saccharibacteria bacterium]
MHDVIVVGAGPAGLAAGLYGSRAGLSVVVVEKLFAGGQAAQTNEIENYPGFMAVSGVELGQKMRAQAEKFGARVVSVNVARMDLAGEVKKVFVDDDGEEVELRARAVILAMGATPRKLGVAREDELRGRGVSYCATCDGALQAGKAVAVVGGGNKAVTEALHLAKLARKVYLVHRRGELRADEVLVARLMDEVRASRVELVLDSVVVEFVEVDGRLGGLVVEGVESSVRRELAVDGVFVAIGMDPVTELVRGQVDLDESGYVVADEEMRTSVAGVYAAGDVRQKVLRQIVTAVADGAIAAYSAAGSLRNN